MTKVEWRNVFIVSSIMLLGTSLCVGQGAEISDSHQTRDSIVVEGRQSPPIDQAGRYVYLIPQSAHIQGDKGSNWRTDVIVHSIDLSYPASKTAWIYFLPADTDNSRAAGVEVQLPSHYSIKLPDIIKNLFKNDHSSGALLFASEQPLIIASRTYNDDPKGTFGQYVGGYPAQTAITTNEEVRLIGLAQNETKRTNMGFANATGRTLDINVTMFKADGTRLGEKILQILPYGFIQKDKILKWEFATNNIDDAFAVVTSTTPNARYFAYASITDNFSNDPVCIFPVGRPSAIQQVKGKSTGLLIDNTQTETMVREQSRGSFVNGKTLAQDRINDHWEGNGPWGGAIFALAVDPTSPKTLYAGTNNGVFKSSDGGLSWTAVNAMMSDIRINALAIDPKAPQTVFAGSDANGVFKTTNGGVSWQAMNIGLSSMRVTSLAIDPKNTETVYMASHWGGLFRSINGGREWSEVSIRWASLGAMSIAIDPFNSQNLLAGFGSGLFKSTDGGIMWAEVETKFYFEHVTSVVFDPVNANNIYVVTGEGGRVYKSSNGGELWAPISGLADLQITTLDVDPVRPQTIYVGTSYLGVFKSTNGGGSWTNIKSGGSKSRIYALAMDPTNPQVIYVGTDHPGVFISANGGETWSVANTGLANLPVSNLVIDPTNSQNLYAGTKVGVFKSTDGGASWIAANDGLLDPEVSAIVIDPTNSKIIYLGTEKGLVFKSTDGAVLWTVASTGLTTFNVNALAIDPTNPQTLYAGTSGYNCLFKSTDGARSWTASDIGLADSRAVLSLAIDPTRPQTVYAGTSPWGVFLSTNGGGWWTDISLGLSDYLGVKALAINPSSPQRVVTGVKGDSIERFCNASTVNALAIDPSNPQTVYSGTECGVFKRSDGGLSWTLVTAGLSNPWVNALAIDPSNPQTVYAGLDAGFLKSTNGGSSWTNVESPSKALALAIDPASPRTVYAGTSGGVFRREFDYCQFAIMPTTTSIGRIGGKGRFSVTARADCPWNATSNAPWITITIGSSGSGNGVITYEVAANTGADIRSGTITIADQTLTVTQSACGKTLVPTLSAPTAALSGQSYVLTWAATSSMNNYELQEATDLNFHGANTQIVHDGSITISHGALVTTPYFTRIRAQDGCDGLTSISPWSQPVKTIVMPANPTLFLPAAAHTEGIAGTDWRTDLEVHNPQETPVSFAIALLAKDQDNSNPVSKTFSLAPNQSVRFIDVLQNEFNYSGSATLAIASNEGSLMATSRTYNLLAEGNQLELPAGATFGQFIPGKPEAAAIDSYQTGTMIQLSQSKDKFSGFRTNLGFTSLVLFPIVIEIRLYGGDWRILAKQYYDLPPLGYRQINTIFTNVIDHTMDVGFAEVFTTTPGGRFFAYASVTDNRSGDPTYIPAAVSMGTPIWQ